MVPWYSFVMMERRTWSLVFEPLQLVSAGQDAMILLFHHVGEINVTHISSIIRSRIQPHVIFSINNAQLTIEYSRHGRCPNGSHRLVLISTLRPTIQLHSSPIQQEA